MSVKQKQSDCETSTQYCCNMYLTSMKHFKSKAATSKHYYRNMCSIGGYNGWNNLNLGLQHLLSTAVTCVVKKAKLSSIIGLKHLKSKPTTSIDHFCKLVETFKKSLQHLLTNLKSKSEQYLHSLKHFKSKVATSKHYYCNMCWKLVDIWLILNLRLQHLQNTAVTCIVKKAKLSSS
jgi:hypothetical protein